jgi:hypothetical protein
VAYNGGQCEVRVYRGGPSRVLISVQVAEDVDRSEADRIAERVRAQVVIFCRAGIRDFGLDASETLDGGRVLPGNCFLRTLKDNQNLTVCVPFEHQTNMRPADVQALSHVIAAPWNIRPELLKTIEYSLNDRVSDVEAYMANYAVLQSVLGGKQSAVDSFVFRVEPQCERAKDTRGKETTIYTKLRNAKGHPSDMSPGSASEHISALLPKLREHVKTALFKSTSG